MKTRFVVLFAAVSVAATHSFAADVRPVFGTNSSLSIGSETIPAPLMLKLYGLNSYQNFALEPGKTAADVEARMQAVQRLLALVSQEGLPGRYLWNGNDDAVVESLWSSKKLLELDVYLAWKVLKIGRAYTQGLVSPEGISADIKLKAKSISDNELNLIGGFLKGRSAEQTLAGLSPQLDTYRNLISVYQELQRKTENPEAAPTVVLKPGAKDANAIRYLKDRLAFFGFSSQGSDSVYDADLVNTVKEFQEVHGLVVDGIIGKNTWGHLSKSLASLKTQVLLNIERMRWLPQNLEAENVWVNLASQNMKYSVANKVRMDFRVINGKPDRKTPVIKDSISYAELNPTWTVPYSILVKDKLPVLRQNPNAIYDWKMKVVDDLTGKEVNPSSINWNNVTPANLHYTLIQKPGPHNALGLVKFPMTNPYSIYLHDTNARELFAKEYRQLSSGCVRLQLPFEFAEQAIQKPAEWNVKRMEQFTSVPTDKPTKVNFNRKIPVYLTYTTIEKDAKGRIVSRADHYGIDRDHYAAVKKFID